MTEMTMAEKLRKSTIEGKALNARAAEREKLTEAEKEEEKLDSRAQIEFDRIWYPDKIIERMEIAAGSGSNHTLFGLFDYYNGVNYIVADKVRAAADKDSRFDGISIRAETVHTPSSGIGDYYVSGGYDYYIEFRW